MNKPLIPIDGSPAALRALAYALRELQGSAGARVELINVQAPMLQPWPGKLVSPDLIKAELQARGSKLLSQARSLTQSADIAFDAHVSIGSAADEIAALARSLGCDAIVMGTRGMGAVADWVLGSVAHKVVHLSSVPVTLVK